jgi:hypothetical protein
MEGPDKRPELVDHFPNPKNLETFMITFMGENGLSSTISHRGVLIQRARLFVSLSSYHHEHRAPPSPRPRTPYPTHLSRSIHPAPQEHLHTAIAKHLYLSTS